MSLSGKSRRRKGHDFQRLIARKLREVYSPRRQGVKLTRLIQKVLKGLAVDPRRGLQDGGPQVPDVVFGPFWIECKHGKQPNIRRALKQAVNEAKAAKSECYPVAICRADNNPITVTMHLEDWMDMLAVMGWSGETYRGSW